MFQTALPFGYLIQFLVFAGAAFTAWLLIVLGLNRRDKRQFRSGLIVAGIVVLMVALAAAQPHVDDWNPTFPAEMLYGRWADGERTLELRADGTFTRRDESHVATGRYELGDFGSVRLLDATTGRPLPTPPLVMGLRVVEVDGEYRIINDPHDPDVWDQWLGYRRTPPAKVR